MKFYGKDKKEYNSLLESILNKSFHKDDYEVIDENTDEYEDNEDDEDDGFIIHIDPKNNFVNIIHDDKFIISQDVTNMEVLNTLNDNNEIIKNIIRILETMLTYDEDKYDDIESNIDEDHPFGTEITAEVASKWMSGVK